MTQDPFGNRLLVIDDEPALTTIIRRIAEASGFEVVVTQDPAIFLNTVRNWAPTVIMLDLQMPAMDGVQLLRNLAADKCTARIIVSSGADVRILQAAMTLGQERGLNMGEVLQKPIRAEALRERLRSYMGNSKLQLTADLSKAISSGQLFLQYQPKLSCRSRQVEGVEALVRWKHPTQGMIPPDQFIGLAEEAGIINRLTDWVVAEAASQAALWHDANFPLQVAVNVSAKDIQDIDLPDRFEQYCRQAGVHPQFMTLEVTETSAMQHGLHAMDVLTRIRIKGFKLSIDDFGTGYSSLVQLQRMPFSEIKIDKSFVMQMAGNKDCGVIVEIVLDLAKKLGLESVAEGVEDEIALNRLTELGCTLAQGYHISRPVAAEAIASFDAPKKVTNERAAAG